MRLLNLNVVNKRKELNLPTTQKSLMIWDVFKGQMTDVVKRKLTSLFIELIAVPANMTHFFQPLDLMGLLRSLLEKSSSHIIPL